MSAGREAAPEPVLGSHPISPRLLRRRHGGQPAAHLQPAQGAHATPACSAHFSPGTVQYCTAVCSQLYSMPVLGTQGHVWSILFSAYAEREVLGGQDADLLHGVPHDSMQRPEGMLQVHHLWPLSLVVGYADDLIISAETPDDQLSDSA